MSMWVPHPAVWGVVAEVDGRIVGSNFLDERDPIVGVGPITVDPASQARGVGKQLMQAVIQRWRETGAPGIRLLQDAFNTDVRPVIQQWRDSKGLPRDPLQAFLESGYLERITKERSARNLNNVSSYA